MKIGKLEVTEGSVIFQPPALLTFFLAKCFFEGTKTLV